MSLTPPKFIKALEERDRDDLVTRLRALAARWDTQASSEDHFPVRIDTLRDCIRELEEVVDARP